MSLDDIMLCAELEDGFIIRRVSNLKAQQRTPGQNKTDILEPRNQRQWKVAEAIAGADAIVLDPKPVYQYYTKPAC